MFMLSQNLKKITLSPPILVKTNRKFMTHMFRFELGNFALQMMLVSVIAVKFKRPKICVPKCLISHIKFYLLWTLYCEQLRLSKRKVKICTLIEIFLIRLSNLMPSFRYRLQLIVVFCGSTGGNSPGRFRPAITLHIEQLSPAAKPLVTKTIITKNMLNNIVCMMESSLKIWILFPNTNTNITIVHVVNVTVADLRLNWLQLKLIVYIWLSLFYWNQFRYLWSCTSFNRTNVQRKKYHTKQGDFHQKNDTKKAFEVTNKKI